MHAHAEPGFACGLSEPAMFFPPFVRVVPRVDSMDSGFETHPRELLKQSLLRGHIVGRPALWMTTGKVLTRPIFERNEEVRRLQITLQIGKFPEILKPENFADPHVDGGPH